MNRRNFFKDLFSGIAALSIPSILFPESKEEGKQISMLDAQKCGHESGGVKKVLVLNHDFERAPSWKDDYKRYSMYEQHKTIPHDQFNVINKVLSSWEARLNEIPKPNLIRIDYHNKTC